MKIIGNQTCKDESALHSLNLFEAAIPARREKSQEKRPATSILSVADIKEDEQDRDGLQLFGFDLHKETTNTEETRVKTHNQSTVLPNSQVYALVCQRTHSTHNTNEKRMSGRRELTAKVQPRD